MLQKTANNTLTLNTNALLRYIEFLLQQTGIFSPVTKI